MSEPDFLQATRASYDAIAAEYAAEFQDELAALPMERAMLQAFADLVRAGGSGPVLEVGSGPGWATAHLHGLGLDVSGLDLSPGMVALATANHPGLRFDVGSMTAIDLPDNTLAGLVAMYSIIHIPPARLPALFTEFRRVLAPGGHLLLVFQTGEGTLHLDERFGRAVDLDLHRGDPVSIGRQLEYAGLPVHARMTREPHLPAETTRRALLLARKA